MVVAIHNELEGGVRDIFVPQMPRDPVLFVYLVVGVAPSVQLVHGSSRINGHQPISSRAHALDKYASPREQPHMLLVFQREDAERSRRVKVVCYVERKAMELRD
jgi:hypothetical protein